MKQFILMLLKYILMLVVLVGVLYIGLIIGEPDMKKFKETIFPKFINDIYVKVYDVRNNFIGGMPIIPTQEGKGIFYVKKVPKTFWRVLKAREDKHLDFANKETGVVGLFRNPRCWNGVDVIGIPNAVLKEKRGGSSLVQQLVKNFYGQDYFKSITNNELINTVIRKMRELYEAKTFYHALRSNNGTEFKRWVSMYVPMYNSGGSVYGIDAAAAIFFGKKVSRLQEYEQILLTEFYKYSYYFTPETQRKKKCQYIKNQALLDINKFYTSKYKKRRLRRAIKHWKCPRIPKLPTFMYRFENFTNQLGTLRNVKNRIWKIAGSMAVTIRENIADFLGKKKNILVTELKTCLNVEANNRFKKKVKYVINKLAYKLNYKLIPKSLKSADIYIAAADKYGNIVRVFRTGDTIHSKRIGSVSKVFSAVAFAKRGDTRFSYYCNERNSILHNYDGSVGGKCSKYNLINVKEVFGKSLNLPVLSAFSHVYDESGRESKKAITEKQLQRLYQTFRIRMDDPANSKKYELSFGVANMSPFHLHEAIHQIAYSLYDTSYYRGLYCNLHIIKELKYHEIDYENAVIDSKQRLVNSRDLFCGRSKRRLRLKSSERSFLLSVLQAPVNSYYGTLRSFTSVTDSYGKILFAKSGTMDCKVEGKVYTQSKWAVGAFEKHGRPYTFVIMIHREFGLGVKLKHSEITKAFFNVLYQSL